MATYNSLEKTGRSRRAVLGEDVEPVKMAAMKVADGEAYLAPTATAGYRVIGVFTESGSEGETKTIKPGIYYFGNKTGDLITTKQFGTVCYVSSASEVMLTAGSNAVIAGEVIDIDAVLGVAVAVGMAPTAVSPS